MMNSSTYTYEDILFRRIDFKQHKPLSEILYDAIKEAILDESLPLGERLNEYSLADRLSISRTPIRKAVKRLTDEGLLECIIGYGAVVNHVSHKKIREVFRIRLSLELILHDELIVSASDEAIERLLDLCQEMAELERRNQIPQLLKVLKCYNSTINETAALSTLTMMLEDIASYVECFREHSFVTRERRSVAVNEHLAIIMRLKHRDQTGIRQAVSDHIKHAEYAALDSFKQGQRRMSE